MSLSIGIVGLPNVGKSTLFNALTRKSVPAENYPFCTIDPSVGVVAVPDERLEKLTVFSKSKKTIPPAVQFVDIAGLVAGASKGEGLGNKFLAHIREVDAILEVVRVFEDKDIIHVAGKVNPESDASVINAELALADLETLGKRLANISKEIKKGEKEAILEEKTIKKAASLLEGGKWVVNNKDWGEEEKKILKQLNLLTMKPVLYALNTKSGGENFNEKSPTLKKLLDLIREEGNRYVFIDARVEGDLQEVDVASREELRKEFGGDDGIENLIKESYKLLGLITYFTTGEDETRGWTIKENSTAPEAGMAIHTDFKDKFIRAEVVFWKDLLDSGSYASARSKGLVRTEGKEYIVKDGDVIEFRI